MSSQPQKVESFNSNLRVAVLMACHNRKNKTVQCLESLYAAKPSHWDLKIYLVDDGSTDGTSGAVEQFDPMIQIIKGNGEWYWAFSMYQAEMSIKESCDAILWLNDDTKLEIDSIERIHNQFVLNRDSVLIGQFRSSLNNTLTYGGLVKYDKHPFHFKPVYARDTLISADTFNGNLVFIPIAISKAIGPIDGEFAHAYADIDYGLRARAQGVKIGVIPGFIGICETNPQPKYRSLTEELKGLLRVKATPLKSQIRFLKRHGGIFLVVFIVTPFFRVLLLKIKASIYSKTIRCQ